MNNSEMKTIEEKVHLATLMPEPGQDFASGLWKQIERQPRPTISKPSFFGQRRFRPAWQLAVLFILVGLVITLLAIGPQRVLAQVQRWLGYVPGIGFVDLSQTRYLQSPVNLQRDGVTLQIDQLIASPDKTVLVFSSRGLPEKAGNSQPDMDNLPTSVLRLPDGTALSMQRQELSYGGGRLEFPALPQGVYRVTFEIDRLPLVPPNAAPEGWRIPVALAPMDGPLPAELVPEPYAPEGAQASANGVTIRILQAAHSQEETALQVQFEWDDPQWKLEHSPYPSELKDDLGNVYRPLPLDSQVSSVVVQEQAVEQAPGTAVVSPSTSSIETYAFPALSLSAREAALQVPYVEFLVPSLAGFAFDPGENPQVGQKWELNQEMEIAGIPFRLVGAHLDRYSETLPAGQGPGYSLEFTFHTPVDQPRVISSFYLDTPLPGYHGGGGGMSQPGVFQVKMLFDKIPLGPVEVTVNSVRITQQGPWEIRWQIPWKAEAPAPVREITPEGIEETRNGLTLRMESASFRDVATVIELSVPDLPPDGSLANVISFDPAQYLSYRENELYLAGSSGARYEPADNVSVQAEGEAGPGRLVFEPVPLSEERVTLHVPALEIFIPGRAAFDVTVPTGIDIHSEEVVAPMINRNGEREETVQTRWVSDPWDVDIPVELAGYSLHFTQAQIERDPNANTPFRLILTSQPVDRELDGKNLGALNLSAFIRPDGQQETGEEINEMMRWYGLLYDRMLTENYDPANWQAKIFLDVTAADGTTLLSGSYHIEIDDVTAWVSGPWELSFSPSGH